MDRIDKYHYYSKLAEDAALRSTCLRRRYGAVIVNNDEVIATGYNGAPRGEPNCVDKGTCFRDELGCKKGEGYEHCVSVHAEMNAIISAARKDMIGGTMYIVGLEAKSDAQRKYADPRPCRICRRLLVNAGIKRCYGISPNGELAEIVFDNPGSPESDLVMST